MTEPDALVERLAVAAWRKSLSRAEQVYLNRRLCWLCEMPLDRVTCCASIMWHPECTVASRIERAKRCLAKRRPRARAVLREMKDAKCK